MISMMVPHYYSRGVLDLIVVTSTENVIALGISFIWY